MKKAILAALCFSFLISGCTSQASDTSNGSVQPVSQSPLATATPTGLNAAQRENAEKALLALRKLKVATAVGVTFNDYSSRLIDATAEVDQDTSALPQGAVRSKIVEALGHYTIAHDMWRVRQDTDIIGAYLVVNTRYIKKYKIRDVWKEKNIPIVADEDNTTFSSSPRENEYRYVTLPLSIIWAEGEKKIDEASKNLSSGIR